jgi:ABC-2 type transport system permease protein
MSALGGSMFPRFLMSETMQKFGLLTFNGWALDGYLKVFWKTCRLATLAGVLLAGASIVSCRQLVSSRGAGRRRKTATAKGRISNWPTSNGPTSKRPTQRKIM